VGHILAQAMSTVREEQRVELARWSAGNALLVGALLAAAGLYAIAWMYKREGRGNVSQRMRYMLVACRASVLVLLGLIGLEPVLARYIHRRIDACTLVLVDDSASMGLADQYRATEEAARIEKVAGGIGADGQPRADLVEQILGQDDGALPRSMAAKNAVKVFTFGDEVVPRGLIASKGAASTQPSDEAALPLKIRPHGSQTNFGLAVRQAVDSLAGAPAAAVVVFSDGGFNAGEDPREIARFLKARNIPLYAVGVGDPSDPVNVRVVEVAGPRSAFKNDPFSITVRLETEGLAQEGVKLDLLERVSGSEKAAEVVESRTVTPEAGGRITRVVFERKVAKPGSVSYIARATPLAYEAVRSDNEREILPSVQILDDKMKILVVAGAPTYDYRVLTRLLERDKTVDLSCWLQSADVNAVRDGNTIITELPAEQESLFKYDAIILIDVDPKDLDPTWGSLVASFVADHGGGLLYEAGHKYTGRFFRSPKAGSILEMLPIVPDPDAEILINELGQYQTRSWPIAIPEEAIADPILRMSDDVLENKAIWASLEGVFWHYPVRREKPVAQVLMRHSNPRMTTAFGPHVLLATQFVGAGRTAFLGLNSTWRWRNVEEKYFNRFWIQMLRYLVEGRLLGGRSRGTIITQKDHFDLGDSVVVNARVLDERYNPIQLPALEMQVEAIQAGRNATEENESEDGEAREATGAAAAARVQLTPVPGKDGFYQGRFVPERTGSFRLRIELPAAPGAAPATIDRQIIVSQPDIEMRRPALQREALRQLVAEAGSGRYLNIDEASSLAQLIDDRSRTPPPVRERPRPLWDNGYVLWTLVGLLTLEWILRKKAKLL
jgi:hypothetical protein